MPRPTRTAELGESDDHDVSAEDTSARTDSSALRAAGMMAAAHNAVALPAFGFAARIAVEISGWGPQGRDRR